jgi:Tol biopolymer transport system component
VKSDNDRAGAFYEISALGGVTRKLLEGIDSAPAFSPDGRSMAWVKARHPSPGESALMVANADASEPRVLATRREPEVFAPIFYTGPSWSPDGTRLVAAVVRRGGEEQGKLVDVRLETGIQEILADAGWSWAAQVHWLPKGDGLLAIAQAPQQSRGQVWFVPYPSGTPRSITNDLLDYRIVSLTADGGSLLTVASDTSAAVWLLPREGGGRPRKITSSRLDGAYGLSFAPDERIVYSSVEGGVLGIWIMSADGSDRRPLTSDASENREPLVADGRVFYLARTPSDLEIRRLGLDGSGARVVVRGATFTGLAASSLAAASDGRWVVYSSLVRGRSRLLRVPVDGGTTQPITEEEAILPAISPDGSRIAFYYREASDWRWWIGVASLGDGRPRLKLETPPPYFRSMLRWATAEEGLLINTMPSDRANLWFQPLDGSPPKKLTDFDELNLFSFDVSPDGKTLALARGALSRDAVLITGFR